MPEFKPNKQVAAVWLTKAGNLRSMPVDPKMRERLKEVFQQIIDDEAGGRIFVKTLTDAARSKHNMKIPPTHYIEYMTAQDVQEFESRDKAQEGTTDRF